VTAQTQPRTGSSFRDADPPPLRIAHVLDARFALEDANGVAQVVRYLARAQSDQGQSVAVLSGVDGLHLPVNAVDSERLSEDILAWQPDLLHFHSVHVPRHVALGARARRAGTSYCVTVHGGLCPAALRRGRVRKVLFNLLLERRFLREAGFVHAVSPHEVGAIRRYGFEGPVVIAPNGVPYEIGTGRHTQPRYPVHPSLQHRQIFMFIGRLDPWQKGLDLLIEAFSHAAPRQATLVLVGPDWRGSRGSLQRLADRLGVLSRVVFTGPVFGDDRARLLAAADVFVHPSRWEGLSLSVLAAAAAGKPCLITRDADPLGGLERANAAVIVEPTVSSIAAGLTRFGSLGGCELKAIGRRAKQVADAHPTWPEIADRLVEAYRRVLATGIAAQGRCTRAYPVVALIAACAPW
jgi:glycosyltransferase involved in cell wall biosynthesis